MMHTQIMQAAAYFHREIRKVLLGIAQYLFEHPYALGTTNAMFHAHPNPCQVTIVAFLAGFQLTLARLFFG